MLPAASKDDRRPTLQGVLFNFEEGTVVATDSYRLAICETGWTAGDIQLLVPASALTQFLKLKEKSGKVKISCNEDRTHTLFDLGLKKEFYERLNGIIEKTEFTIIGAGVDKKEHVIKYGKGAKDPYALSLSFVLERLIFCLDLLDKESRVEIVAEKRGKKEDGMLISHYNSIIDRGTYYVSSKRFLSRIAEFQFRTKRDNVNGLQLRLPLQA